MIILSNRSKSNGNDRSNEAIIICYNNVCASVVKLTLTNNSVHISWDKGKGCHLNNYIDHDSRLHPQLHFLPGLIMIGIRWVRFHRQLHQYIFLSSELKEYIQGYGSAYVTPQYLFRSNLM